MNFDSDDARADGRASSSRIARSLEVDLTDRWPSELPLPERVT